MKKLLAIPLIAASLAGCSATLDQNINLDTLEGPSQNRLEQMAEERRTMKGFTSAEREVLSQSKSLISERYLLPEILFYNLGDKLNIINTDVDSLGIASSDTSIVMGRSPGLIRDALEYLPEEFPVESYPDHYLILLKNDYDYRNALIKYEYGDGELRPIDKRDQIPWDEDPMLSVALHEAGHIYFEGLSEVEKQRLVDEFMSVDNIANTFHSNWAESLVGHACYHSQFYSIFSDGPFDCARGLASEQFSDIFAYHILGHDYKQYDMFFQMKLDAVTESLQRFKPSSELPLPAPK